ncbi:hypothetical protein KKD91_03405 [Patescibacteria group bacterium]|nr:hypothetical protein [Patescibacteria group bacterium]
MEEKNKFTKKISIPANLVKEFVLRKLKKEELRLFFSFLVFVVLVLLGVQAGIFRPQIPQDQIIKEVAIKQNIIIAGQPVKWVKVVTASAIQKDKRYLELPKDAQNITIKTGQAALSVVKEKPETLTQEKRKELLATLIQPKTQKPNILVMAWHSLTASLENAADQIKEIFKEEKEEIKEEKKAEKEEQKQAEVKIIETKDNKFVDLTPFIQPEESVPPAQEEPVQPVEETSPQPIEEIAPPTEEITPPSAEVPLEGPTLQELPIENVDILETVSPSDQPVIEEQPPVEETPPSPAEEIIPSQPEEEVTPPAEEVALAPEVSDYIAIEYETPVPEITEQETDTGKLVAVSAPDEFEYTNVLAYTTIPEIFKVGQENKIKIKWQNNNNQDVQFNAYDLNNNGKLDYVEWTVPHLSEQIFNIIFISKAFKLDQDRNIIEDIYDQVQAQDNVWVTIENNYYVRITFQQILTNQNDITLYAKPTNPSESVRVEVYQENSDQLITAFENIDQENIYKVYLTNLQTPTDVFDLKIIGNVDIDWIVDPTPATITDNFADTTKIADSTNLTVDTTGGTVSLSASSSWVCGNTLVDSRDAKTYSTVLIGSQCWMRQNINVGTLTAGANTQGTSCASIQKYCYSDTEANCTSNGGLYQWNQAMCGSTTAGAQGICPTGWHIPTHDEYTTLELTVCTSGTCATDFPYDASTTGWRGTNEGTTLKTVDSTHFSGLLAGDRGTGGSFFYLSSYGYFWTSLQSGTSAWYRKLSSGGASVYRGTFDKAYGFSVRCLKN